MAAAAAHIDATPPSSWTLDAYGASFADTLACLYLQRDAIRQMQADATFADLCQTQTPALDETDGLARAAAFLGQWFSDGLVTGATC